MFNTHPGVVPAATAAVPAYASAATAVSPDTAAAAEEAAVEGLSHRQRPQHRWWGERDPGELTRRWGLMRRLPWQQWQCPQPQPWQ